MKLNPINPVLPVSRQGAEQRQSPNDTSIGDTFSNLLDAVNRQQIEAEAKQTELLTSPNKDIHGTMIALEKAEISMRLMLQVRNKLVAAYEEIMRMQV
ncbi:MAG: flagellar hook-basal body complex protein FliE [Deltaproteobacteria bacterium]|jgi:flagellar hook-basal body complex protein FliE|nr:flagellar hook-basal body complex protein FliE [Deltaproteobacteria bacterium]MDP7157542.1 flagellar hook-basal body complex protein FliE [SAR324 cluster bacterium]MDP7317293.1 flagellar hook-basal body complex protein FliE [SAR324 cluster bacterium]MDP7629401.1 flagellar hook-basal body complex protein FliE [SAR324 cluster bacterium]|tara:strand:+ start:196 stop:489 length:294 start_codon:yes stop_codon:yes gene_type:complete